MQQNCSQDDCKSTHRWDPIRATYIPYKAAEMGRLEGHRERRNQFFATENACVPACSEISCRWVSLPMLQVLPAFIAKSNFPSYEAVKSPDVPHPGLRSLIGLKETNSLPKAAIGRLRLFLSQTISPISILQRPAQPASALIKVLPVFVSHLPARATPAVLPTLLEARVQVGADDALVQLGAADVLEAVERVLVGEVLDEAEAAGGLVEAVQPHDEPLDLAALAEQLVHLLLGREEREVPHVERRRVREGVLLGWLLLLLGLGLAVAVLAVAVVAVVAAALVKLVGRAEVGLAANGPAVQEDVG